MSEKFGWLTRELKPADEALDLKVMEKILTKECLGQSGAKIADRFLEALGIPVAQFSGIDPKNLEDNKRERVLAESLTNKAGAIHKRFFKSFLSRDPRHFLEGLNEDILGAMDPKLAKIFKNEYEHQSNKKNLLPFAYVRLPGGIDCVLKGYQHTESWQKAHGEYLVKTAKNAQVLCIEGYGEVEYGKSLNLIWQNDNNGDYDTLMRKVVKQGFDGLFAEIDTRDHAKAHLDSEPSFAGGRRFPNLPYEFLQEYFGYLRKFFPVDASQIKSIRRLEIILEMLSTTYTGLNYYDQHRFIQNIDVASPSFVDKKRKMRRQMTGLELGESYFSDAMAAIKLHLIANEMYKNRIDKGVIVDFEGADHLSNKFFFLRNPYYALMTVLKSPHFILAEKLAKEGDVSSVYPAFSPDEEMFKDMFKQIYRLEFSRPEKDKEKTEIDPGPNQMPMVKYEIAGREKELEEKIEKLDIGGLISTNLQT